MIISRKYATYEQLKKDEYSYKAMKDAIMNTEHISREEADVIIDRAGEVLVHNTNIETGFPSGAYRIFRDAFDELDKSHPFDNGYTYQDVGDILCFPSRKGNAITQVMMTKYQDLPKRIVQVIAFERSDGDKIRPIDPWELPDLMV